MQADGQEAGQAVATTHPVLAGHDPIDPRHIADDASWWAIAHQEAPVFLMPQIGMWAVTAHRDVVTVLGDPETFSSAAWQFPSPPAAVRDALPHDYPWNHPGLVSQDDPEHARVRTLMRNGFTPRRVARLEPLARATAERLVETAAPAGEMDALTDLALPTVMTVLAGVLGIDIDRMADFRQWTVDTLYLIAGGLPEDETVERSLRIADFDRYVRDLVQRRRAAPEDDVVSDLVGPGSDLDDDDVAGNVATLMIAGQETTTSVIVHALLHLLKDDRRLWTELLADRSRIPAVVEEAIRISGASRGLFRVTTREVELGGVTLPAGTRLQVLWAAANMDKSVFPDPSTFDPDRDNLGLHLGLGRGTHVCVGAALARMEVRVTLDVLLDRLPGLSLAPGAHIEYVPSLATRSPTGLRVRW